MLDPHSPFFQARLKHIWANEHISQFHAKWEAFLKTDFCRLTVEDNADGGQLIRVLSIEPLPYALIMSLGDAVHNLRCALDFVISALLGWKDTRLTFPMGESREELVTSFSTNGLDACPTCKRGGKGKGRNATIEMAVPGIGQFIVDEIRPYKASDNFIWPLGKLDARDKHRLLIPAVVPQALEGINVIDKNNNRLTVGSASVGLGGVVNLAHFAAGGIKVENYGKPTADIFLHEPGIIEYHRALPALVQMSQSVSEVIDRIEEFAVGVGWSRPV